MLSQCLQALSSSNNLSDRSLSALLSTNNFSCMNLNVTCVMQGTWVIHVVNYTSAYKGTLESHLSISKHCNLHPRKPRGY